jgi:arylsulfatase A-like enzyme
VFALCAIDVISSGIAPSSRSWALIALFSCVVGALLGAAWRGGLWLIAKAPRLAQPFILAIVSLVSSGALARSLGAFGRLSGPYRNLAIWVLAGCGAAAVALTLLGMLLLPTQRAARGWGIQLAARFRLGLAVLFAAISGVSFYAEQRYYPDSYPQAHTALRLASSCLATTALALLGLGMKRNRHGRWLFAAWCACAVGLPALGAAWPRSVDDLTRWSWPLQLVRVARDALDFDRDGYAGLLSGGDCDDLNPRIHPGVRETPGNGIDDNCLLGDAKPTATSTELPKNATEASPFDIVLITVDSLRPDHLGMFNPALGPGGRNTTPNIDAWAAETTVAFEHVYATGGWTSISVASLMRGLYPRRLAWTRYYETWTHRLVRQDQLASLPPSEPTLQMFPLAWNDPHPTLPALLKRRGMRTVAVVHDGFSRMLTRGVGVERDFDDYREVETDAPTEQSDAGSVTLVERELARAPKHQRLFLWVHFFGIHSINEFHPEIPVYGPTQSDAYDHEVKYFDTLWPRLWAAIRSRGDNVVTVLTSDHGEVFADPIRMHGFSATEADLRVPLFVHVPGVDPKRVTQLASTIDLYPTLLALTRTPAPQQLDGLDLQPWISANTPTHERQLIADTWRYTPGGTPIIDLVAALNGRRKVVFNAVDQTYRAFDITRHIETPAPSDERDCETLRQYLNRYVEDTGGALAPAR